ncbi:alpha/beta fold hydrolase [Tateyamaria sp. SN6-1]|uniref:alpha/beta fold hydrolase n=1 Tax=Tateyamaria sp. SN6-1 TaxID=3092148 RepID=UPI0039F57036
MLAIHCSLAHSGAWRGVATALGDGVTVHAFDLPDHGQSGDWDGSGDMHDAATAMALSVLDDLGPVDVIGHSFGATVALRLAVDHPERIRRAALFEPVYFAPSLADDPDFAAAYADIDAPRRTAYEDGRFEDAARAFNRQWAGAGTWMALSEKTRRYMTDRIGFVHHSTPFLIHDSAGLLAPGRMAQADMPILLMQGETSPWAATINGAIARRLPNAMRHTVPEAGHMGPVTHPAQVARALTDFLGLSAPAAHQ